MPQKPTTKSGQESQPIAGDIQRRCWTITETAQCWLYNDHPGDHQFGPRAASQPQEDAVGALATFDAIWPVLFDDASEEEHGQLCPYWTRRHDRDHVRSLCDCWVLRKAHRLASAVVAALAQLDKET